MLEEKPRKGSKTTVCSENRKQENEYRYLLAPCISCATQSKEGLVVEPLQDQYRWVKNSPQAESR